MTIAEADARSTQTDPIAYVGVGASAGGLEAIGSFISEFSADTGAAFILVQHLSPDHKSLMSELLNRRTTMPVCLAEDGLEVKRDHVYLIPPKKMMTIFHGRLLLTDQDRSRGVNLAIDEFLQSLATDQTRRAIAVILSGTGSDGVRGIREIKEQGGLVMVQDNDSARFDGMPSAAAATGLADLVAPPEQLASNLAEYLKRGRSGIDRSIIPKDAVSDNSLTRVFAVLREQTGVDFSNYKPTTVLRRLERRLLVNHLVDLDDYLALLASNPNEAQALYRELLIGVTRFFRDAESFKILQDGPVQDLLTQTAEEKEFRVWVAGCSSGEEAYSLAIMLTEIQARIGTRQLIKIFATDLDQQAIATAQVGVYPASIAAEIPRDLLTRYFQSCQDGYQVVRPIREMTIFARHNLMKDPPFTNMDLVVCRNVLIYFKSVIQQHVLESFNYALKTDGILFLGSSETIGELGDRFEILDAHHKIFRSLGRRTVPSHRLTVNQAHKASRPSARGSHPHQQSPRILERFFSAIADELLPVSILVNEQLEILHILGDSSPYLRLPAGAPVNDIARLARADIHLPLTTGIQRSIRTGETLRFANIQIRDTDEPMAVDLRIRPIPSRSHHDSFAVVMIQPRDIEVDPMAGPGDVVTRYDEAQQDQLTDLEQELQFTRESLQATIEELETANEELQATNEELLSSNEELQSTNEELQSTNEELHTVNAEYQDKLHELAETNADIDNLLTTIATGVLILDESMLIRRFSPMVHDIFGILPGDVGRPLGHLNHRLINCDPMALVSQVGTTGEMVECEVTADTGRHYILRVAPFTIGSPGVKTGGVVVTFIDITAVRQLSQDLSSIEDDYRLLFEAIDQAVSYQDADGTILACNQMALQIMGRKADDMVGRSATDPTWEVIDTDGRLLPPREIPSERARLSCRPVHDQVVGFRHPATQETRWIEVTAIPVTKANGELHRIINVWRDISNRHLLQLEQQELIEKMQLQSEMTHTSWFEWFIAEERVVVSPQHLKWFGLDPSKTEVDNDFWPQLVHPDDQVQLIEGRQHLLDHGHALVKGYRIRHADGHYLNCFHRSRVVEYDAQYRPIRAIGILGLLPSKLACQVECLGVQP